MCTDETGTTGELGKETILEEVDKLQDLLGVLNGAIDNLVDRMPGSAQIPEVEVRRPNNIFDEIILILVKCNGLVTKITNKVEFGISRKVKAALQE